jgi:hypothetical protein
MVEPHGFCFFPDCSGSRPQQEKVPRYSGSATIFFTAGPDLLENLPGGTSPNFIHVTVTVYSYDLSLIVFLF